jgi:hypothetical protein
MFIIVPRMLTPILAPTIMLIELSMFITTGNLTTSRTSPIIPPIDPITEQDKPSKNTYPKQIY